MSLKRGFTFVETSIVIGILVLICSVVVFSFFSLGERQSLDRSALNIFSILSEARSLAISSKDFSNYGVHINQNSVVLFRNSLGTDNKQYDLGSSVNISSNIFGDEVIFNKVTGETSASGTIMMSLEGDLLQSKTIIIYKTGVIDLN
jgi:Tfp pilus assembly protein FimT